MPDMSITIGHLIDNPTFDMNCGYTITDDDCNILYDSASDKEIDAEILIRKVAYITIRDGKIVIEAQMQEV